ncbi:hypothetical protein Tsubulata_020233 [Turnera subulata]|uniref:Protein TIFY n=1 Tax=Turnera subulata TaxID=218843 RepID=A0A9Q0FXV2_9ROSI|nr:hypothetical protein Tsubulata_020233 [Turnera subulata]
MASLINYQRPGYKAQEKTSFAQTCNLLSQYLKERGSLGDISLGLNGKLEVKGAETARSSPATTLNLLPNMESLDDHQGLKQKTPPPPSIKSVDFLPQFVGFGPSSDPVQDTNMKADLRKSSTTEPETAPMTIFYGGKMIMFNDFPADKAKEIMALLGCKSNSDTSNGSPATPTTDRINATINSGAPDPNQGQKLVQGPPKASSNVPMARRASLHRFFAKRKERAAARAPYQMNDPLQAPRSVQAEIIISNASHLELKL